MKIEEGKELRMENVLSLRKKMTQQQMQEEMKKIGQMMSKMGIKKNNPLVTTTFALEEKDGQQIMDIEILIPINSVEGLPNEYRLKKEFILVNAIYVRYEGNPMLLQNVIDEMIKYINENNLQQITSAYNVYIKDASNDIDLNNMIIDVYIGVSSNKL